MMQIETFGNATLYCGNSLDLLPEIGPVDVVITDPPYGDRTHKGARSANSLDETTIDFASITETQFFALCRHLVEKAARWVVMTCEWRHAAHVELQCDDLIRLGVWIKPNGAPQFTGDRPGTGWEAVAILHRKGKKRWNGGGHHAVWHYPIEQGEHPTQKPLALLNKWIYQFSDAGETILDPFMGSGTTGIAALNHGRKFIGCEIDQKYFDLACRRIEQSQRQLQLAL